MRNVDYGELYERVRDEILRSKEIMFDVLHYLGFQYDSRISNSNRFFFKVPFVEQKTGSLNVFQDKSTGNWLFNDFNSGLKGNVFTLLNALTSLKEGEKIPFLVSNYSSLLNITDEEVELILNKEKISSTKKIKFKKIGDKIKTKSKQKNISSSTNLEFPYVYYGHALFADSKILKNYSITVGNDKKIVYPFKETVEYVENERKIKDWEFLTVSLVLVDKNDESKVDYNGAIAVPFGIFDYDKLKAMQSDDLKELLKKSGAELRLAKKINDLKSYTKVNYEKELRKSPTILTSATAQTLVVFESIFDYLSVQSYVNTKNADVLIMNGSAMIPALNVLLESNNYKKEYKELFVMQQNDEASYNMLNELLNSDVFLERIKFDDMFVFNYKAEEYKKDINDLVKEGIITPDSVEKRKLKLKITNPAKENYGYITVKPDESSKKKIKR